MVIEIIICILLALFFIKHINEIWERLLISTLVSDSFYVLLNLGFLILFITGLAFCIGYIINLIWIAI